MAETPLVEADIEAGRAFVQLLDKSGLLIKGAFWLFRPDTDRWRLVIVTDEAKHGARDLYLKAINAGAQIDLANVEFQSPDSPFFKALSGLIRIDGLSQVRMSQNTFNGLYIQDALVYRMAA